MPQTAEAERAPFPRWDSQHRRIGQRRPARVQGMKTDTAAAGVKNRVREQMIYIDRIGRYHDQPCLPPMLSPEYPADRKRCEEMASIVEKELNDIGQINSPSGMVMTRESSSAALRFLIRKLIAHLLR